MTELQAYKIVKDMDADLFADWNQTADSDTRREFFKAIHWQEGFVYCSDREYAIKTGYDCARNLRTNYAVNFALDTITETIVHYLSELP